MLQRSFEILGVITPSTVYIFFPLYITNEISSLKKTLNSILSWGNTFLYIPEFLVHKKENTQDDLIDNKQYIKFIFWWNTVNTSN